LLRQVLVLFLEQLVEVGRTHGNLERGGIEYEWETSELVLKALLFHLQLVCTVVRLMVLKAQVDKAVANLVHNIFALFLKSLPIDIYNIGFNNYNN
jgi:membrane protein required for beta-lactamase induction